MPPRLTLPRKKLSKSIFFLIVIAVLSLFAIELILRLSGGAILLVQNIKNRSTLKNKSHYRIMCVGESTTEMGGEHSYPIQLKTFLNEARSGKEFSVINKGIPGIRTEFIVHNLPFWLDEFKPDMVVAMMGINDAISKKPAEPRSLFIRATRSLRHLRIYKLRRWLRESFQARFYRQTTRDTASVPQEPPPSFVDGVKKEIKKRPAAYRLAIIALAHEATKNYSSAARIFEKLSEARLSADITRWAQQHQGSCLLLGKNYPQLAQLIQAKLERNIADWEAREWIRELINLREYQQIRNIAVFLENNFSKFGQVAYYFDLQETIYSALDAPGKAKECAQHARQLRRSQFSAETNENLIRLNSLVTKRGIALVVVQYPLREIVPLQEALKAENNYREILFIENNLPFQEELSRRKYAELFTDQFAENFGHCTPLGNKILAENVGREILKKLLGHHSPSAAGRSAPFP